MKAVILAGGFGTRIAEESDTKPKPMVEIGNRPLLWHIMKIYSHYGVNDFIICLGYKGYVIKEYFVNYQNHTSDININLTTGKTKILNSHAENWNVTLIDTGIETMTGGRLKRISPYLDNETFFMTYGDGLSDIDINAELEFHKASKKMVTIGAVQPPGRFGALEINQDNIVTSFKEKPKDEIGWINGGFFILEPQAIDYIGDDLTSWESEPLKNISKDSQLAAFKHFGFWMPCDTLRDKRQLQKMWENHEAPWKVWNN
jgi:glucose-1-phosphate cytidylyltransferase